jgi:hypothetical protein
MKTGPFGAPGNDGIDLSVRSPPSIAKISEKEIG